MRRKKQERVDEFKRLSAEFTKDGAVPTAEQSEKLNGIFVEIEQGGAFDRQIRLAEQFAVAEGIEAQGRESSGRSSDPLPHEDPGNTRGGKHHYSMLKAIREAMFARDGAKLTGLERETHLELQRQRAGEGAPKNQGILVPWSLPVSSYAVARAAAISGVRLPERYNLDTNTGGGSIPTILEMTMIDILRARMVTVGMGARVMENMQGLFAIPRQSATTTITWVTQGNSVSPQNQQIDQVPFSPHTGGVQTVYTRQFLEQTNQSAEAFIREDHAAVIARGYEIAAFNGPGSGGAPLGLLQNPLITVVSAGANGGAPTWANVVELESKVAEANADMGALGYITDASMRGTLKTTPKVAASPSFPIYIWDNFNSASRPLNDYPAAVTNLLPQNLTHGSGSSLHALIYGNWNDLIYAFWSGMDVIVDPYTQAGAGSVVITTLQDGDTNIRHPESFAIMPDLISTQ